ncbi:MAG: hypothetical protein STSR0001_21190 [Methanothrix sp.]
MMFIVFRCSCGRHLYSPDDAKTRTCPCGKRTVLSRVRILATAPDARAAGEIVRKLQLGESGLTGFSRAKL